MGPTRSRSVSRRLATLGVAALVISALGRLPAPTPAPAAQPQDRPLDVPFVPTPQEVVDRMLELAEIREGDVLYDLGCGDGRIVIAAAKRYGIKAIGVDIDPERIAESRANVAREGVGDLVEIRQADLFQTDFSDASVVTMYLLPNVNDRLKPKLQQLKPGSRIVSHSFSMRGAKPKQTVRVETASGTRTIFLWTVPWEEE
jgi:precorrin-6B methylase 2